MRVSKLIFMLMLAVAMAAPAVAQTLSPGEYYIKSVINTNFVVDNDHSCCANGNNIHLWEFNGGYAQRWMVISNGDASVSIYNMGDYRYAIDVNGCGAYNGNNVQLWIGNHTNAQRWYPQYSDGAWVLKSACNPGYALDVNQCGMFNGNNIQIWEANGTNAQRWYFVPVNTPAATTYPSPVYPMPVYTPGNNPCGVCSQTGRCSICGGSGESPNHAPGIHARCGGCGGSGRCPTCGGRGYY